LLGSRIAVANVEARIPLFGTREFGLATGFLPTELFFFADAGVAWWPDAKAKFNVTTNSSATDRIPSTSIGGGARLLLSYITRHFYWAKPFQRPGKGWVFGFNIVPGW